jgi:hypothetical protein
MSIPYQANGIYPSEAMLVIGAARWHKIDLFLESGIDNGHSTEYWASSFGFRVWSCDMRPVDRAVRDRLAKYANLAVCCMYGHPFLHELAAMTKSGSVGVFIDGPKYEEAAQLCQELLEQHPNIALVAIHDALERAPFECITFHKTFSIDHYTCADRLLDAEAHAFNAKCGVHYPHGPGVLLVERKP